MRQKAKVNDKYKTYEFCKFDTVRQIEFFEKQKINYGIKHNLRRHLSKWKEIEAYPYILKVIEFG